MEMQELKPSNSSNESEEEEEDSEYCLIGPTYPEDGKNVLKCNFNINTLGLSDNSKSELETAINLLRSNPQQFLDIFTQTQEIAQSKNVETQEGNKASKNDFDMSCLEKQLADLLVSLKEIPSYKPPSPQIPSYYDFGQQNPRSSIAYELPDVPGRRPNIILPPLPERRNPYDSTETSSIDLSLSSVSKRTPSVPQRGENFPPMVRVRSPKKSNGNGCFWCFMCFVLIFGILNVLVYCNVLWMLRNLKN